MGDVHVELLWWRGCPSWERAAERVREQMLDAGLDPSALDVREIDTESAAVREEFVGSPTIRIEGRDVQPPEGAPIGLTCRIYRTRDGGISPLPDPADLRDALLAAIERQSG